MATSVEPAFHEFATNLEITNRQENVVSERRRTVVDALAAKLSLESERSKLIGSYDRHTLTRYLAEGDVDVLVVLSYNDAQKQWHNAAGTEAVLDRFRAILAAAYPSTVIRRDRNCITMRFSDFRLDVVPAFRYSDGYYTIPDTIQRKWLVTDPIAFAKRVTDRNTAMSGTFVPLIKVIKGWNRHNGWPISSFHLECMLLEACANHAQAYTYSSQAKVFFSRLATRLAGQTLEPARGERVDTYLDLGSPSRRSVAIAKAKAAAVASAEAYNDANKYGPNIAIPEWKALMGEFFPSYG
jgi:Second Messenger Oligonucleotide or Dinucleotide Synthetase domain